MVGAYAAYFSITFFASRKWPVPAIFIFLISFAAGSLVAMSANYIAYKPLRYKPRLSALITAIGVSLFLEYFFSALPQIGPSYRAFPTSTFIAEKVFVFKNLRISSYVIIDVVVAAILMAFITYLIKYTKIGMAMRAASQDKDAAKLMGIDLEKVITITFLIGGGFAGIAGVLTGITYPRIGPYMGILPGLKAFIAAVLGGIGNVPGAMIGSYIMGISETFATAYKSLFGDGIAFLILIIVLLFRPQGLLGETTAEKV